ncbi:TPA: pyruvate kinase, partial [Candidatus Peregrinibacteria bacterium]|nr:pyruvate kinase [Candidatus Peregrinibacteria bacterium]
MTQIIATIGPATHTPEKIKKIVAAGANFFRLNFSHGSHQWHQETIQLLRKISPSTPIILDTKGPEMRTGDMPSHTSEISVEDGEILTLVLSENLVDIS